MEPTSGDDGRAYPRWWESVEGKARLEFEIDALENDGVKAKRDEESFAAGIARLILQYPIGEQTEELHVTFPDFYPYFRFVVEGHGLNLLHHQNPFAKILCVLGRNSDSWRVSDTVASVLKEQIPKLMIAGTSEDAAAVAHLEEQQAEPFSEYYPYAESMILFDSQWTIPDAVKCGEFSVGLLALHPHPSGNAPLVQGLMLDISDEQGKVLYKISETLRDRYSKQRTITGRWSRAPQPIATDDPKALFNVAETFDSGRPVRPTTLAPEQDSTFRLQLRGVLFPEEVRTRKLAQGWIFVVRSERGTVKLPVGSPSKFGMTHTPSRTKHTWSDKVTYFARGGRAGRRDLGARIPELRPLEGAIITVIGAGCIGAPSILEFARLGVKELRIVDPDILEPGTAVRWPLGLRYAGQYKVRILSTVISDQYPYTATIPSLLRVGCERREGLSHMEVLGDLLEGTSLLYYATADWGVQRFLATEAKSRGIPYIAVSATHGGWGGNILRIRPGKTAGCWMCWRLNGELPAPPAKPVDALQPAGCGDITFTGAGFDMVTIAMHGVRLAVSTICDGKSQAYAAADWDLEVISFRDPNGAILIPSITVAAIPSHIDCDECRPITTYSETA